MDVEKVDKMRNLTFTFFPWLGLRILWLRLSTAFPSDFHLYSDFIYKRYKSSAKLVKRYKQRVERV